MKILSSLSLTILISLVFISCGKKAEKANENTQAITEQPTAPVMDFSAGEKIYKEKCIVCHLENGQGIKGQFPPLANSDYLLADKKRAVEQVLNGSNHEITVNGEKYTMPMPPQVDNHQDAVNVVNYILNSWGNNGGTITLEEVKDIQIKR